MKLFREFVLGLSISSAGSREEKIKWSFKLYDTNEDGLISVSEMKKAVKAIFSVFGDCPTKSEVSAEDVAKEIFEKMDVDKDGNVSTDEFIAYCLNESTVYDILSQSKL